MSTNLTQFAWRSLNKKMQWLIAWIMHAKFNVGASIITVNHAGEFLLGKHVYSGKKPWRLIGGYMNRNENIFNAAKREVKEELGVDIEIERVLRIRTGFIYRVEITLVARPTDRSVSDFKIERKELEEAC